jgi:RNA chaperone Hfq
MHLSTEYQERFISELIANQTSVAVYLKNGIKLTGKIVGVTNDVIFLNQPVPQMIYKKQISTILPLQSPVTTFESTR